MQPVLHTHEEDSFTVHHLPCSPADEAAELVASLSDEQPSLSPRFFYDQRGSQLFESITRTPEYYPTRTEAGIFADHLPDMLGLADCSLLLEPGSGNCRKAEQFFRVGDISHYVPIEISADFLLDACRSIKRRYPELNIDAVCADFTRCRRLPDGIPETGRMLFFPGSTIGNFEPEEAVSLLGRFRTMVGDGGYALIGVDLKKKSAILDAAYNDAAGLTASFNLNALHHLNARLGCNFEADHFEHRAFYDPDKGRVEMHLDCLRDTQVNLAGQEIVFRKGQSIHTENSWKYSLEEFRRLAILAGFESIGAWTDRKELFSVHMLRANRVPDTAGKT